MTDAPNTPAPGPSAPAPAPQPPVISFTLTDLVKWLPMIAVPAFGWIWHAENRLTTFSLRVSELEEQVDNYRQTEQTLIEVKTRLEEMQRTLSAHASEKVP